MIDWTSIILAILSGTSVGGIFEAIRYRKQNKEIRESEATKASAESQKAQIDVAKQYWDDVCSMMEQVKQSQINGQAKLDTNQEEMKEMLANLDRRMDRVEEYLNGPFHQYLADKQNSKNVSRYGGQVTDE